MEGLEKKSDWWFTILHEVLEIYDKLDDDRRNAISTIPKYFYAKSCFTIA
jgi:hypothetical protein